MSRRKKRKGRNRNQPESLMSQVSTDSIEVINYKRKAKKLSRLVKNSRSALFGYCYSANIIRWASEEHAEHYYQTLYSSWLELNRIIRKVQKLDLVQIEVLRYVDPLLVFLLMVGAYLTDYCDIVIECQTYLEQEDARFSWSGHSKPLIALIFSLTVGYQDYDLTDFSDKGNSLVEEVATLWNFEEGVDIIATQEFAPLHRHSDDETDSLIPTLREVCIAVLDKYAVDFAFNLPGGWIEYDEIW